MDRLNFPSNHDHDVVGPVAGWHRFRYNARVSATMPGLTVKNEPFGTTCFGGVVEPKVQFGVFDEDSRNK